MCYPIFLCYFFKAILRHGLNCVTVYLFRCTLLPQMKLASFQAVIKCE